MFWLKWPRKVTSGRSTHARFVDQTNFERKHGGGFDAQEFDEFPERYISNFSKKFAPYASCIVNGIYWSPETPRLLTIPDAKALLTPVNSKNWLAQSKGERIDRLAES
jgi:saccharopine dehydrogenase (NADP+, L-lysine-forming) (EC 1.5.1.8)/saccharopine dehydrogenase (NAD+, L-glutamate-forming) (EC 1.5.1.9)